MILDKKPEKSHTWTCFKCENEYPNTLRYCPVDNIAKKHSDNLFETAKRKKEKKWKTIKLKQNIKGIKPLSVETFNGIDNETRKLEKEKI